ncbi:MAG: hypothetical protein IPG61_08530 [bacterium]|nr:hypothetical protein [bacterium]
MIRKAGLLPKPATDANAFPDLLMFHSNPDDALRCGWSEMKRDLRSSAKRRDREKAGIGTGTGEPG